MNSSAVLARAIARLRKERGITQAELAEAAGLSVQFVAALEQATKTPSLDTIDALCDAFGVTSSSLFAAGEPARGKRRGTADQVAGLLDGLTESQQKQMLVIIREALRLLRA